MLQVYNKIEDVEDKWNKEHYFINLKFLRPFYYNHNTIKHLFIVNEKTSLYAQIFKLEINKIRNYLKNSFLFKIIDRLFEFNVLYLANSFITNIPSFKSEDKISLDSIITGIKEQFILIVIPDFLYRESNEKKEDYIKVEVEQEMTLDIRKKWTNLEHYLDDLNTKYRKKKKLILKNSDKIKIKRFSAKTFQSYTNDAQKLFNNIMEKSRFNGPDFNVNTFINLLHKNCIIVYGYFYNNKLVGFSSEIHHDNILYSYYVGFEKEINKLHSLYGRILIETIRNAINEKKKTIVFGRTANEFKSNFGATAKKSYVYMRFKNSILHFLFKPILKKIQIKKWTQRHPFKKDIN